MAISSWIVCASVVALSFLSGSATAEEIIDVCACSPSKYTFTLDLSLTCPPVNVTRNGGIAATFCQISPFGDVNQTIDDLVPVEVEYVDIVELGQAFEILTQHTITGSYMDGDTIDYVSISGSEDNGGVPRVIQLNIYALNAAGETIVNFFAISYSNDCTEGITLIEGGSAGWVHFAKLEPPTAKLCPDVPTEAPIEGPTEGPTEASTEGLTEASSSGKTTKKVKSLKSVKDEKSSKYEKVEKSVKDEKSSKYEKFEKSVKDEKSTKYGKVGKSAKSEKEPLTPELFMAMDRAADLFMDMSMSMSMSIAESRSSPPLSVTKSAKVSKLEKSLNSVKAEKDSKVGKSLKLVKDEKSGKDMKSAKEVKRRLRIHPIYKAL